MIPNKIAVENKERVSYILRETTSEEELERLLHLRYQCFNNSDTKILIKENDLKIDLNYYDRNAYHYGVYKVIDHDEIPIGYFRQIFKTPTYADNWVQNICKKNNLSHSIEQKPNFDFPCLDMYSSFSVQEGFPAVIEESTCEISRLMLIENERSLKLIVAIIQKAFAVGLIYSQNAIIGCFQSHSKLYKKMGFKNIPGADVFQVDCFGKIQDAVILHWSDDDMAKELEIIEIQNQYHKEHRIVFSV